MSLKRLSVTNGVGRLEATKKDDRIPVIRAVADRILSKIPKNPIRAQRDGHESERYERGQLRIRTEPVCWGIPMDEMVPSRFFSNFLELQPMPWDDWITNLNTYIYTARNYIHDNFLKGKANWLVGLDSDVLPPPNFLERLLEHKKDFVSGWYKKKSIKLEPVVYDWRGDMTLDGKGKLYAVRNSIGEGLEKVAAVGLGCYVMSRELAEKLGPSPYRMPFEGKDYTGEDLYLCNSINELGYGVWVDWTVACAHTGLGVY